MDSGDDKKSRITSESTFLDIISKSNGLMAEMREEAFVGKK